MSSQWHSRQLDESPERPTISFGAGEFASLGPPQLQCAASARFNGAPWARRKNSGRRGAALIGVLWLTAALAAIAFSVGALVRGEIERATNSSEGTRAYFLARGALERMLYEIDRAAPGPAAPAQAAGQIMVRLGHIDRYALGEGDVVVEVVAEAGKVNINRAPPEQIELILFELGLPPDRAALLTAAIVDWRGQYGVPADQPMPPSQFDQYYFQRKPSFRPARASFQEIEELLLVHGVTPEIFYGGYRQAPDGTFVPRPGLRDCFSAYRGNDVAVDLMSATAPVIASYGIPRASAEAFMAERQVTDMFLPERIQAFLMPAQAAAEMGRASFGSLQAMGGRVMYNLRATGRVSGTVRSISALIQMRARPGFPYDVVRWEDQAMAPAGLFPEKAETK